MTRVFEGACPNRNGRKVPRLPRLCRWQDGGGGVQPPRHHYRHVGNCTQEFVNACFEKYFSHASNTEAWGWEKTGFDWTAGGGGSGGFQKLTLKKNNFVPLVIMQLKKVHPKMMLLSACFSKRAAWVFSLGNCQIDCGLVIGSYGSSCDEHRLEMLSQLNENPWMCLTDFQSMRILLCGKNLYDIQHSSTVKILSKAKSEQLDVYEAQHFCETQQLPFRVQSITRLNFARSCMQFGTAVVIDLSASKQRPESTKFYEAFVGAGYNTKAMLYSSNPGVDSKGYISLGVIAGLLEIVDQPSQGFADYALPQFHFDDLQLGAFIKYLSTSWLDSVRFLLRNVAEEERTHMKLLQLLEQSDMLGGKHFEIAIHNDLNPGDVIELRYQLEEQNAPGKPNSSPSSSPSPSPNPNSEP